MSKLIILLLLLCPLASKAQYISQSALSTPVIKSGEVKRGQGLYQALLDVSIENAEALKVINALSDEVEFSKLKLGDKLVATFNSEKELIEFSFSQNKAEKHVLKKNPESKIFDYEFVQERTNWFSRIVEGTLQPGSTLQADLLSQGLKHSVVNEIVNVLMLQVNFRMNARIGDKYKTLLQERIFENEVIETKVLFSSYKGMRAGNHEAFFYEDSEKSSTYTAHYTAAGQALISSGLRYPLSSLHVRSSYGMRRHPVTGQMAMHRGVDLRGRVGAPVHAVADGVVTESGYDQFSGNRIAIRHRDGSKSYYLHLNNRGVRKGDHVRSFEIIGSVGATGRVTGAHLHFGFKTPDGQWMNPLNKRMIATPKLTGQRFNNLQLQINSTRNLIADLRISAEAPYLLSDLPNRVEEETFTWDLSPIEEMNI